MFLRVGSERVAEFIAALLCTGELARTTMVVTIVQRSRRPNAIGPFFKDRIQERFFSGFVVDSVSSTELLMRNPFLIDNGNGIFHAILVDEVESGKLDQLTYSSYTEAPVRGL